MRSTSSTVTNWPAAGALDLRYVETSSVWPTRGRLEWHGPRSECAALALPVELWHVRRSFSSAVGMVPTTVPASGWLMNAGHDCRSVGSNSTNKCPSGDRIAGSPWIALMTPENGEGTSTRPWRFQRPHGVVGGRRGRRLDVPADDLGFGEPSPRSGKIENFHAARFSCGRVARDCVGDSGRRSGCIRNSRRESGMDGVISRYAPYRACRS